MNAKEIGREAGRIFNYNIPSNWIFRSQEDQEDYGIDGEIEIADSGDHATGFIFKVQIKGSEHVNLIDNMKYVSHPLKVARLKYYINQLEIPVMLVVVDITSKRIYWKSLQNDLSLKNEVNQRLGGNLNVHLSANDIFIKEDFINFLNAVNDNYDWLRLHALNRIKNPINKIIDDLDSDSISRLLKNSKNINLLLFCKQFDELYKAEKYKELFSLATKVLKSETESIISRFTAGLVVEKVYLVKHNHENDSFDNDVISLYIYIIKMIRKDKSPEYIKLYALLLLRRIRLKIFVEADYHHFITKKISENDSIVGLFVNMTNTNLLMKTIKEVNHVIRLINKTVYSENIYVMIDMFQRVAPRISFFANRLVLGGMNEQADYLYRWLQFFIETCLKLSEDIGDESYKAQIIILNCTYKINTLDAQEELDKSKKLANQIKDGDLKNQLLNDINIYENILKSKNNPMKPENEVEYFIERAKALGMDPDDQKNKYGQIIKQGLEDYNPERVLKYCEHLFVFPSRGLGYPARIVGLSTATSKYIYCLKHGNCHGGWSLDFVFSSFQNEYCTKCKDNIPRETDWKWNSRWQNEQLETHKEIIENMDR